MFSRASYAILFNVLITCGSFYSVIGDDIQSVKDYQSNFKTSIDIRQIVAEAGAHHPDVFRASGQKWLTPVDSLRGSDNTSRCNMDLAYIAEILFFPNPKEERLWALQMVDSFGKPPAGILRGQVVWPGSFDECLQVSAPASTLFNVSVGGFNGRYAWLTFAFNSTISNVSASINVGACLPSTCADDNSITNDYKMIVKLLERNSWLRNIFTDLPELGIRFVPNVFPLTLASTVCICLCGLFVVLVVVGTLVDVVHRWKESRTVCLDNISPGGLVEDLQRDIAVNSNNSDLQYHGDTDQLVTIVNQSRKATGRDFFLCFSAVRNGEAILNTDTAKGELLCIHGVRFISMAWIILCHTYDFSLMAIANVLDLTDKIHSWPIQLILQGSYSVDTFFVLSGCLLTYQFLRNKEKFIGIKSWIMFYVHRYVRLTPVYAMLMFVFASWWNSLGSGPFWTDQYSHMCSKTWWWNVLYVNNFLEDTKMCMAWTWYLANDMQFYIISPLFLIAFKRSRIAGVLIVCVLLVACWITTAVISRVYDLPVIFANSEKCVAELKQEESTLSAKIYSKPYARIGSYLIGVLLGFLLNRANGSRHFLHKSVVIAGWALSQTLSLLLLYGLLKAHLGPITSSAHNSLARSAWGISVAWVIYACLTGHGGPVNTLLSWKGFIPLSRLTYCAYLVHPMVMMWYISRLRTLIYFSDFQIAMQFLSFIALSYGVAFIASLLFESPIIKLEKLLRNK